MKLSKRDAEVSTQIEQYRADKLFRAQQKIERERKQAENSRTIQRIDVKDVQYPAILGAIQKRMPVSPEVEQAVGGYDPGFYERKQATNLKFCLNLLF